MRVWYMALTLILVAGLLAGCGGQPSARASDQENPIGDLAAGGDSETYVSGALDASSDGALPASNQLALGTLLMERTEHAVTPVQAKALLPLWQAIQGGALQADAETNAVLEQIEGAMTPEQLAAIDGMQLTRADLGAWMEEQGVSLMPPPGVSDGQTPFGNLSEEESAAVRATRQAGGTPAPGPGGFGNLSEEERAAMRATAEASGMALGNRPRGADQGQLRLLAAPVVELLTERAGQ